MPNSGPFQPPSGQTRRNGPSADGRECKKGDPGESERQDWKALDFSGRGIRNLSDSLFQYTFLNKLYINNNELSSLPPLIGRLRLLQLLDASGNKLTNLPPELGMLINLRNLNLDRNQLTTLPNELGSLYHLGFLGLAGNPMREDLKQIMINHGSRGVITALRESLRVPPPLAERSWIILEDTSKNDAKAQADKFQVLCYNILCKKYATEDRYGYSPSWALAWRYRKGLIRTQLIKSKADIICLQEVEFEDYNGFFAPQLALEGYKGDFYPKTRAKTMSYSQKKSVDGCATFFKSTKFSRLDKQGIDFSSSAIQREDMKRAADIYNRVKPIDNTALITFLENKATGSRLIVANVHILCGPQYKDVKLVQVALLMDELTKWANKWAKSFPNKSPASLPDASISLPAVHYASGSHIPLVICGDFNSAVDSGVYELLSHGNLASNHDDLAGRSYGNFTAHGMSHPFSLKSSYSDIGELKFTNYTPGSTGVVDYIWHSMRTLTVTGLMGDVDMGYIARVPGLPNMHFPSDHIPLHAELQVRPLKMPLSRPPPPLALGNYLMRKP